MNKEEQIKEIAEVIISYGIDELLKEYEQWKVF